MLDYIIEEIVLANTVKLQLLVLMRIYSVIDVSKVVRYRELVKKQRVKKPKLVEIDKEKE